MLRRFRLLFFLLLPLPAASQGPVAKYSFNDGSSRDEAGKNDAKPVGVSLVPDRFGNAKSAYYLQANSYSYLNLGTSSRLKPVRATIALWINLDKVVYKGKGTPYNPIIITKSRAGNDFYEGYFMGYEMYTHKINANIATQESQGVGITTSDTLVLNSWHHLAIAYDDKYLWLYMDGILQNDNKPMPKNFRTQFLPTDSVVIGSMANSKNDRCTSGSVDDILIYDRVLSPDEIYELYKAPDPNKNHIYLAWFYRGLALCLLLGAVIWLIIKRYKTALEREKEKNRIDMRLIELETKAIRTQMNPHFMFNSLNTLQRFILEEDIQGAHLYLSKFSKLLRKILESSISESISLTEEVEILNSYLEIEQLRFSHLFDYSINCIVADAEHCYIPFLLVQPFVENAVWHGLLPLQGHKQLTISFSAAGERTILCVVEDNGVGRHFNAGQKNPLKKKSLALDFIKQRLELLERSTGIKCGFTIIDKEKPDRQSAGTRVEIFIPRLN